MPIQRLGHSKYLLKLCTLSMRVRLTQVREPKGWDVTPGDENKGRVEVASLRVSMEDIL